MMRGKFKNRWIMVGLVWVGVLMIDLWNIEKIDQIREIRTQREIFLRDQQFWNNNAKNISQILQRYSSFTQNVESLKLGLLQLENDLKVSALSLGLNGWISFKKTFPALGSKTLKYRWIRSQSRPSSRYPSITAITYRLLRVPSN